MLNLEVGKAKTIKSISAIILGLLCALVINFTVPTIGAINGTVIEANAVDKATDAYNDVQKSSGGVLGSEVKEKVTKLSADAQNLVLIIVMGLLMVSTLWTSTKFTGAGDNPQQQAKLKTALTFQVLGLIFVASYSGLVLFALNNLNLFD